MLLSMYARQPTAEHRSRIITKLDHRSAKKGMLGMLSQMDVMTGLSIISSSMQARRPARLSD